jgi:hypothetical protein
MRAQDRRKHFPTTPDLIPPYPPFSLGPRHRAPTRRFTTTEEARPPPRFPASPPIARSRWAATSRCPGAGPSPIAGPGADPTPEPRGEGGHREMLLLWAGDEIGSQEADQENGDPDAADPDGGPQHPGQVGCGGSAILGVAWSFISCFSFTGSPAGVRLARDPRARHRPRRGDSRSRLLLMGKPVADPGQRAKPVGHHAVKGHGPLAEVDSSSRLARSLSSSGQCR